jgi:peptide methionine sulfoxide reductase MsrB
MASCDDSGCKGNDQSAVKNDKGYPLWGNEGLMTQKGHGTCSKPPGELLYGVDRETTDKICCFNRHYAEHSGYFLKTAWMSLVSKTSQTVYFDAITGKPLFRAPVGRSFEEFLAESKNHGWPSFRDQEVVWDNVRVLPDGEAVSIDGTHLGHNIPDKKGNRYCINLVSIAGMKE